MRMKAIGVLLANVHEKRSETKPQIKRTSVKRSNGKGQERVFFFSDTEYLLYIQCSTPYF